MNRYVSVTIILFVLLLTSFSCDDNKTMRQKAYQVQREQALRREDSRVLSCCRCYAGRVYGGLACLPDMNYNQCVSALNRGAELKVLFQCHNVCAARCVGLVQ